MVSTQPVLSTRSRPQLAVAMSPSKCPCATVPSTCLWDLVVFLSYHRVRVDYRCQADFFAVSLPRSTLEAAQQLLDAWSVIAAADMQAHLADGV